MRRFLISGMSVVAMAATAIVATPALAVPTKLSASDASSYAHFGNSLALAADGNTALIGNEFRPSTSSAAYVFTKAGGVWGETAQLVAADGGTTNDELGFSVALSDDGNIAVAGAPAATVGTTLRAGAVYVFARPGAGDPWSQVAKLSASSPTTDSNFGASVAVSSDGAEIVVGASSSGSNFQGAAYFYTEGVSGTWTQSASVTGSSEGAQMGRHVAISGDGTVAAVGQPRYNYFVGTQKKYAPNVTMFAKSGSSWAYSDTITTPAAPLVSPDGFGQDALSFDADGERLLAGASSTTYFQSQSVAGVAYLYTYASGSWGSPLAFFGAAAANRRLGTSGALAGDGSAVFLGAPTADASFGAGGGAVFAWTQDSTGTWVGPQAFTAPDVATGDYFGYSLALSADLTHPLIAAPLQNTSAGAAYAF